MTAEELARLEKDLWNAADQMRANSKFNVAEYRDPMLGIIFLRFAYNRFVEALNKIQPLLDTPRGKRKPTTDDFKSVGAIMLPEKAQWKHLASLPENRVIGEALNEAMKAIEDSYPDLQGILPKSYQLLEPEVLRGLIKIFSRESLDLAKGDVFGRVYEYFLLKFAMNTAQEGGEFFTPPSLVNLIVRIIEPDHGIVYDPACGSGGMFVQTGHFIDDFRHRNPNEAISIFGTEKISSNVKLSMMNLYVHGLEGKIQEGNTYYEDTHNLLGKCDYVMANPPFNVDGVDKNRDFVKEDRRLPFGLPRNDNANYLWIQYFYSYLNATGRAGFVMAASATDAGHSEKLIRENLIKTGHVDVVVSVANNFFYTRSLPCHLWFMDKGKPAHLKDKVLMIDARNTFRKVNTTLNDFTEEHLDGLSAIARMYRGETVNVEHNQWLKERFPEGKYQNIAGLCKVVDLKEIKENDWSLTPGRYVGTEVTNIDDQDFAINVQAITDELEALNSQANELSTQIVNNLKSILKSV